MPRRMPPSGAGGAPRRPERNMSGDGTAQNGIRNGDSPDITGWIAVGLLIGWILLGNVGPMFDLAPGVRAWYPPAALLAAALTYWGAPALVPVILAASLIAIASPAGPEPLWRVLLVSAALKVIYWAGAKVLRRVGFDPGFSRTVDVALFAGVFAATAAVAAFVAVIDLRSSVALSNPETLRLMRSFWIGDVVAVFSLAPAMLVVAPWLTPANREGRRLSTITWSRRDIAQLVSIPVAIVCAALLAPSLGFFSYALCFLPLGWIALTHGPRVAALANVLFVVGALYSVRDITGTAPKSLEVRAFLFWLSGFVFGFESLLKSFFFGLGF